MRLPDWILFASDATIYGLWGCGFLVLSTLALLGEHRRAKRKHVDDVGIMPWRDIGALTGFLGLALMSFAAVGWLGGS